MLFIFKHAAANKEEYLFNKYIKPATALLTGNPDIAYPKSVYERIETELRDLINKGLTWNRKYAEWYVKQSLVYMKENGRWPNYRNQIEDNLDQLDDYLSRGNGSIPSLNTTFDEAFTLSDIWHKKMIAKGGTQYRTNDVWANLSDGFNLVNVKPQDLKTEGRLVGHCVGSYVEDVQNEKTIILSLRDSKNLPHATIEITPQTDNASKLFWSIDQIKGKENKPQPQYGKWIEEAIKFLLTKNQITLSEGGFDDYLDFTHAEDKDDFEKRILFFEKLTDQPDIQHKNPQINAYLIGRYGVPDDDLITWLNNDGETFKKKFLDSIDIIKYGEWLIKEKGYQSIDEIIDEILQNPSYFFSEETEDEEPDYSDQIKETISKIENGDLYLYEINEDGQNIIINILNNYWEQDYYTAEFLLDKYEEEVKTVYIESEFDNGENDIKTLYDRTKKYYSEKKRLELYQKKVDRVNRIMKQYNLSFPKEVLDWQDVSMIEGRIYGYADHYRSDQDLAAEIKKQIDGAVKNHQELENIRIRNEQKEPLWDQQLSQMIPGYSQLPLFDRTYPLYQFYDKQNIDEHVINYMKAFVKNKLQNNQIQQNTVVSSWLTKLLKFAGRKEYLFKKYTLMLTSFLKKKNIETDQLLAQQVSELVDRALSWNQKYSEWYCYTSISIFKEFLNSLNLEGIKTFSELVQQFDLVLNSLEVNEPYSLEEIKHYIEQGNGSIPAINTPLNDIFKTATDWSKQLQEKASKEYKTNQVIADLGDGYRLVNVPAIDVGAEGKRMHHCVGGYKEDVEEGYVYIFSIRNEDNDPVVTIEAKPGTSLKSDKSIQDEMFLEIIQMKGIQNRCNPEYGELCYQAINALIWSSPRFFRKKKVHVTFGGDGGSYDNGWGDFSKFDPENKYELLNELSQDREIKHTNPIFRMIESTNKLNKKDFIKWINEKELYDYGYSIMNPVGYAVREDYQKLIEFADWVGKNQPIKLDELYSILLDKRPEYINRPNELIDLDNILYNLQYRKIPNIRIDNPFYKYFADFFISLWQDKKVMIPYLLYGPYREEIYDTFRDDIIKPDLVSQEDLDYYVHQNESPVNMNYRPKNKSKVDKNQLSLFQHSSWLSKTLLYKKA